MKIRRKRRASICCTEFMKQQIQKTKGRAVAKTKKKKTAQLTRIKKKEKLNFQKNKNFSSIKRAPKIQKISKIPNTHKDSETSMANSSINTTPSKVITGVIETKHLSEFSKRSIKQRNFSEFMTPYKKIINKPTDKSHSIPTNPLINLAKNLKFNSPLKASKISRKDVDVPKGCFKSGHKVLKINRSVLIEGRVLFDIEWKRAKNQMQPLNSLVTENTLKKNLKPRTYKKMLNDYRKNTTPKK